MKEKVSGPDTSQDFLKPLYIDYDGELKPLSEETPERQNLILSNMVTGLSKVLEDKIIVPPPERYFREDHCFKKLNHIM